jgi:hypothetical protein
MVVALLLMHGIGALTPLWQTGIYTTIFGLGVGSVMQPITLAAQNAMPPRDVGVATSSTTFFRQMGGTLGTAVFLSVLFSTVGDNIRNAFASAVRTASFQVALHDPRTPKNPANQPILSLIHGAGRVGSALLNDTSFLKHADPRIAEPFFVGFSKSMDLVFILGAGVVFIGFLLVLFLPELPLRTMSGLQAQQAAREAAQSAEPVAVES